MRASVRTLKPLLAIVVVGLLLGVAPAEARKGDRNGPLSLDEAVEQVRQRTGARVLSADTVERDGRRYHDIRVITEQGRVRRYRVDGSRRNDDNDRRRRRGRDD